MAGKRLVYWHSYRADEILMALRVAKEFGFKPNFTHILEGYSNTSFFFFMLSTGWYCCA